jgi:hypothetical protein
MSAITLPGNKVSRQSNDYALGCARLRLFFGSFARLKRAGLVEEHPVADEIVGFREMIIEPPRFPVRVPRMPIEPRPALSAAELQQVFDQRASDASPSEVGVDEESQVAAQVDRPGPCAGRNRDLGPDRPRFRDAPEERRSQR